MNKHLISAAASVAFLVGATGLFVTPSAQAAPLLSYAAKFICGPQNGDIDVVKGLYATTINIHNPNFRDIKFLKKAVIALPERTTPRGVISQRRNEGLAPDQAIGVDCRDIRGLFAGVALPQHFEGFLVIEVPPDPATGLIRELDVIGKYTARLRDTAGSPADPNDDVTTLDVEQYSPKRVDDTQ